MTLRPILIILSFTFSGTAYSQMYRVFFADKGIAQTGKESEQHIPENYINSIKQLVDSVYMISNWLNYALVEANKYPATLLNFSFVKKIEEVIPLKPVSLQVYEHDSVDPVTMNSHRQWQLDTMGYNFFSENNITGSGIVIAIIDAGFSLANNSKAFADIYASNRVLKTYDFIENDTDVYHGSSHGTAVWSCIAGNFPEKQTGLATGASFILLRSEDEKKETMADEDRWIQAIEKAYEWGADIVNSSVGFSNLLHKQADLNGQTLISKAADIAAKKGMLVVVSAGNEWFTFWKTLCVPADAEGVIAVGGIDKEGNHSYFSSVGPTADGRAKPDVVAPGTCVAVKGNDLVLVSGTSFSAPLVTGYLACMLELKGKNNFTRDSLKFYGGLYPWFDYVFGYGVPNAIQKNSITERSHTKCNIPEIDKQQRTIAREGVSVSLNPTGKEIIFLKIVGIDGKIKFSKRIKLLGKNKFTIPASTKKPNFNYGVYHDPNEEDVWILWVDYCYFEY